jgi:hypothetical protein
MSKQTALQWFKDVAYPYLDKESKEYVDILFNHALQMEREQIEDSYQAGDGDAYNLVQTKIFAKQYYNETYGGKDEK